MNRTEQNDIRARMWTFRCTTLAISESVLRMLILDMLKDPSQQLLDAKINLPPL
jgi:hypothetical protein